MAKRQQRTKKNTHTQNHADSFEQASKSVFGEGGSDRGQARLLAFKENVLHTNMHEFLVFVASIGMDIGKNGLDGAQIFHRRSTFQLWPKEPLEDSPAKRIVLLNRQMTSVESRTIADFVLSQWWMYGW